MRYILAVFLLLTWVSPALAERELRKSMDLCKPATQAAERKYGVSPNLLRAISLTESGRWLPKEKANIAWPWTVASGSAGQFFPTKHQAIRHVQQLQAQGVRNIDVGCMQINLRYHPDAFNNLNEAFDPRHNTEYAADFLSRLFNEEKSWSAAAGRYHSSEPTKNMYYREKVMSYWNYANNEAHQDTHQVAQTVETRDDEDNRVLPVDRQRMAMLNNSFRKRLNRQRDDMEKITKISNTLSQYRSKLDSRAQRARADAIRAKKAKRLLTGTPGSKRQITSSQFAQRRSNQLDKWRRTVAKPELVTQSRQSATSTQPRTLLD